MSVGDFVLGLFIGFVGISIAWVVFAWLVRDVRPEPSRLTDVNE